MTPLERMTTPHCAWCDATDTELVPDTSLGADVEDKRCADGNGCSDPALFNEAAYCEERDW